MSLANAVAVAGTVIRAAQHNALVYLLDGVAGYGDAVSFDQYSSAATPALTVRNLHASGTALQVQDSAGTSVLAVTSDAVVLGDVLTFSSASSWPAIMGSGSDGAIAHTAYNGVTSHSARSQTEQTAHRTRLMHGTVTAPFVNNNGGVNYVRTSNEVTADSYDWYGPKSSLVAMSRQRPVSNNCTGTAGHGAGAGGISQTLWEFVFDSKVSADASGNPPQGVSGIYGLVGRAYADVAMSAPGTCKHGVVGGYPAITTYDHNALTGIGRIAGTSNAGIRAVYAEATVNVTAANGPTALGMAIEATVRQGADTTTPADDAPPFSLLTLGPRYLYGMALEMGRESLTSGRYGTVGLYIAGDRAISDGAWRSGIVFGRSSCLEFGIDFYWMNSAAPGSPGTLPTAGLIRLANTGWITARNNADDNNVNVMRVAGNPDVVQIHNGAVNIGASSLQLVGTLFTTGTAYVGDTANADVTLGLTINQGAADDQILALKSSDVGHGVTTLAETDTYGAFQKNVAGNGGLMISGFDDTANIGLRLKGVTTTADTTRSTSGVAAVIIDGYLKSGTGVASLGANGNILAVRDNSLTQMIVDIDGDVAYNGTTGAGAWDDHDDVALLEAFRLTTAAGVATNYRQRFSDDVQAHTDVLVETGVLTRAPDGRHFVSTKALNGLMIDALRQLSGRLAVAERQLAALPSAH